VGLAGAEEQVVLFVYRGERCAQLVKDVYEVLRSSGRRARIRVVRANIQSPEEFPAFLEYLGELYGRQYVEEYEKYRVRKLPALVVGGVKLFEGVFPTREELAEMLGAAKPAPAAAPSQPAPEAKPAQRAEPRPAGRSCTGCVFFDRSASRCLLLRVRVEDPARPPCGR
jgi:hypothetical protein